MFNAQNLKEFIRGKKCKKDEFDALNLVIILISMNLFLSFYRFIILTNQALYDQKQDFSSQAETSNS